MLELVVDGDRRSIATPGLRLAFRWQMDRWLHAVEVGPSLRPVAWPIEGDPTRDDPSRVVSPAYQQLEFQEGGGGHQALLVGQSGPHHFSAVFTVRGGEKGAEISVDVADRCRSPVRGPGLHLFRGSRLRRPPRGRSRPDRVGATRWSSDFRSPRPDTGPAFRGRPPGYPGPGNRRPRRRGLYSSPPLSVAMGRVSPVGQGSPCRRSVTRQGKPCPTQNIPSLVASLEPSHGPPEGFRPRDLRGDRGPRSIASATRSS